MLVHNEKDRHHYQLQRWQCYSNFICCSGRTEKELVSEGIRKEQPAVQRPLNPQQSNTAQTQSPQSKETRAECNTSTWNRKETVDVNTGYGCYYNNQSYDFVRFLHSSILACDRLSTSIHFVSLCDINDARLWDCPILSMYTRYCIAAQEYNPTFFEQKWNVHYRRRLPSFCTKSETQVSLQKYRHRCRLEYEKQNATNTKVGIRIPSSS